MTGYITARADEPFTASSGPATKRSLADIVAERSNPDGIPADLREALFSLGNTLSGDSRDFAANHRDAWTFGVLLGWECEDHAPTDHCDTCGTPEHGVLADLAERHGWDNATVARLKRYRAAVARALGEHGNA